MAQQIFWTPGTLEGLEIGKKNMNQIRGFLLIAKQFGAIGQMTLFFLGRNLLVESNVCYLESWK